MVWIKPIGSLVPLDPVPEVGSHSFRMFMHEIGHTLGLDHPKAGPCDTYLQSLMSYRDYPGDEADFVRSANLYQATPMLADAVALQTLYGESKATYGNTVHKLSAVQAPRVIFDQAGIDTIDASELEREINVTLYEEGPTAKTQQLGSRLTINEDGAVRNFEKTVWLVGKLENVIGTAYGDFVRGGVLSNFFQGGNGDDTLHGGGGDDTLAGDEGNDTLIGGEGNDTLIGGPGADTFIATTGDVIRDYEVGVDRIVAP
jgi:serralysin